MKRIFQVNYTTVLFRLATGSELGDAAWGKASFSEVLRSREPDSLSSCAFIEDRLSRLVRVAIESNEVSLSRGAEILRLDLEAMRERVASSVE